MLQQSGWNKVLGKAKWTPNTCHNPKSVILRIWCHHKGIRFFHKNQTLNSDQLFPDGSIEISNRWKWVVIVQLEVGSIFQLGKIRAHGYLQNQQKVAQFRWDILRYPPLSLDIAHFDFYLFRSLDNSLIGKNF